VISPKKGFPHGGSLVQFSRPTVGRPGARRRLAEQPFHSPAHTGKRKGDRDMRHLLSISDLSVEDVEDLLRSAATLKRELNVALAEGRRPTPHLDGKSLAMIFEKPSLRTRCAFEIGMFQLGGHAVNLSSGDIGRLGERESIADAARGLSRWAQIIHARVFNHESLRELVRYASIPVINSLSDFEHPTQAMADYLTIREHRGSFDNMTLAWIGDSNNVAHSLMIMAATLGHKMTLAIPAGYDPKPMVWAMCEKVNSNARKLITVVRDPKEAVRNADVIYTDTWVSMGMEEEAKAREKAFASYQVNRELLAAAPSHAFVLHDMPAKRGKEITDEVIDGPRCKAIDQAENRMHTIKAILCWCLGVKA